MTGATFAHDLVVGNLRSTLRSRLRAAGSPCGSFGADIGVHVTEWTLRRPDVAVYCPPFDYSAVKSDRPRLVAEVLSRSTEHVDYFVKVEEYKTIPALQVVLLVSPQTVDLGIWTRDGAAWHDTASPATWTVRSIWWISASSCRFATSMTASP